MSGPSLDVVTGWTDVCLPQCVTPQCVTCDYPRASIYQISRPVSPVQPESNLCNFILATSTDTGRNPANTRPLDDMSFLSEQHRSLGNHAIDGKQWAKTFVTRKFSTVPYFHHLILTYSQVRSTNSAGQDEQDQHLTSPSRFS